jgi:hypothetical protein
MSVTIVPVFTGSDFFSYRILRHVDAVKLEEFTCVLSGRSVNKKLMKKAECHRIKPALSSFQEIEERDLTSYTISAAKRAGQF